MIPECYFAASPPACDYSIIDAAHVIPQRALKREHAIQNPRSPRFDFVAGPLTGVDLTDLLDDVRNIVPACRAHHHRADHGFIEFPPPELAYSFAANYGLEHHLPIKEREEAA